MGKWRITTGQRDAMDNMGQSFDSRQSFDPGNPFHVFCRHFPTGLLKSESFTFTNHRWVEEAEMEMRVAFADHLASTGATTEMIWLQEVWPRLRREREKSREAERREAEERRLQFDRMSYKKKVARALVDLGDPRGSSLVTIKKYFAEHAERYQALHINKALQKGVLDGSFVKKRGTYKVAVVAGKHGKAKEAKKKKEKKRRSMKGST